MQVLLTGRHVEITAALRRYVETKLKRLERFGVKLSNIQVVVGVEKFRHTAEATCMLNGRAIQAKVSTEEMYASIDQLVDKVESQIRKRKDRLINHKGGSQRKALRPKERAPATQAVEVKMVRSAAPVLRLNDAVAKLGENPSAILVFVNEASNTLQVLRRLASGEVELIDPEPQAPMELHVRA
ncbi:MAG TPA: ribosome-associated translation inhibitor RaiA [Nitrospiraceae bacterium]|jgi:putative sigma-54 modulation protein|nr:ribosome-associated translation inhibitor RaiA [Nitrospiraceae bacterium]